MARGRGIRKTATLSARPRAVRQGASGTPEDLPGLVSRVQGVLTPDLLKPEWRAVATQEGARPFTGHCYAASEALYHLLGGKAAGLKPKTIRHEGGAHWWLEDADGRVIDVTAAQFETPVPYADGRGCGFLTREPSRRAATIMQRLRAA